MLLSHITRVSLFIKKLSIKCHAIHSRTIYPNAKTTTELLNNFQKVLMFKIINLDLASEQMFELYFDPK